MSREKLDAILSEIRALREKTLTELNDLTEDDFQMPTNDDRWDDVRRALLRFGDHMREHTTQIDGIREQNGMLPTMSQRILAEGERSWGNLLAACVGLTDEDLEQKSGDDQWSVMDTLKHMFDIEVWYLNMIRDAINKDEA